MGPNHHPGKLVFIIDSSTDCDKIMVGQMVEIVYALSGTRKVAVTVKPASTSRPDADSLGGVGGTAKLSTQATPAVLGLSQTLASSGTQPPGGSTEVKSRGLGSLHTVPTRSDAPSDVTLDAGQTTNNVMTKLGRPETIAVLDARTIYIYKIHQDLETDKSLKIIFVDGKLSDIY